MGGCDALASLASVGTVDQGERTTIELVAGRKTSGEPVLEELVVTCEGRERFRVEASPGLVLGLARGDLIEVDREKRSFVVLERGGNVAVHVYGAHHVADQVLEAVHALGGWLDGRAEHLMVFTVPVRVGFPMIESVFTDLAATDQRIEWYFGNVYDPADGMTPLRWWVTTLRCASVRE